MENENEQHVVPPESEREKTEEGHTTSEENEIVSVENAETSETAAQTAATDNAEDLPKKKGQRDMTEGVIWKQILAFALPILLSNVMGGLSGPAVFPVAVRMVYQVRRAVSVPILGMGGIRTGRDIVEMLLAGADAVAMGTVMFNDPTAPVKALRELEEWMDAHGVKSVSELSGAVEVG